MAYRELIKSFESIRSYLREFYVYGFRHRGEIGSKSDRSYDNERRRVESWLGGYIRSGYDTDGKRTYLSVDSRDIPHNPLYRALKAKSFTDNDAFLHFCLMDLLPEYDEEGITLQDIISLLEENYLNNFDRDPFDDSTIRKKLNEYIKIGLIEKQKQGRAMIYRKTGGCIDLNSWKEAVTFFSEAAPLGAVGSFILDKYETCPDYYRFKHHNILYALDSEVLCELLEAISDDKEVTIRKYNDARTLPVIPFRIYISTWYGRRHLLAWDRQTASFCMFRIDRIRSAVINEKLSVRAEKEKMLPSLKEYESRLWGSSDNRGDLSRRPAAGQEENQSPAVSKTDHIEFEILVEKEKAFVAERLFREKRCGTVTMPAPEHYLFSADVFDAQEVLPWVLTFTGRIVRFSCSRKEVEDVFHKEIRKMTELYEV